MRKEYELYAFFSQKNRPIFRSPNRNLLRSLKGRAIKITRTEELEYAYTAPGRCYGCRSRGKSSSILVRRKAAATETRLLLANPRLLIKHG